MRAAKATCALALTLWGGAAWLVHPSEAAEFRVVPSLTLSEEFNDNLFEVPTGERSEFITRVLPSVAVTSQGAGLVWDMSYGLDYRNFARGNVKDELDHTAALNGKLSLLDGFLKVEAGDTYSRVSLDVARDVVMESLVVNQSERNVAFISPYLSWHPGENCALKTGYSYKDVRYWDASGIDKREHQGVAELNYELTSRLTFTTGYTFVYALAEPASYHRHDLYAGLRHDYGQGTVLFGSLGNSWQSFSNGTSANNPFWSAGASKDFGFMAATIGTRVQYAEDPLALSTRETSYDATLSRAWPRGMVTLTGTFVEYEVNQFAQPERQRKQALVATGRYELSENLTLMVSVSGDHLDDPDQGLGLDYPYRLFGNSGLEYLVSQHMILGANYTHVSYRRELDSSAGSAEVNRVIVEVRLYL